MDACLNPEHILLGKRNTFTSRPYLTGDAQKAAYPSNSVWKSLSCKAKIVEKIHYCVVLILCE